MVLAAVVVIAPGAVAARAPGGSRTSAALTLEQNRPYVELGLAGPGGRSVHARFWLDSGGGAIILVQSLARRLGLKPSGSPVTQEGSTIAPTELPRIRLGGTPLKLSGVAAYIVLGRHRTLQGTSASGALPLRALRSYEVALDYPRRRLTVAPPGALPPQGEPVPAQISQLGFITTTLSIDGKPYGFLLDTGGQYCMISRKVLADLARRHPNWPRVAGAYGPANMMLGQAEAAFEMMRIGAMQWGPFSLTGVGSVSRPFATYEKNMSELAGVPVVGSIGGNVLRAFRVDIDYPGGRVYLKRTAGIGAAPLKMVGVTLEPAGTGYVVAGIAPGAIGVRKGDRLLRIGALAVTGATTAQIMRALQGPVGSVRRLVLERVGKQRVVRATVQHLL